MHCSMHAITHWDATSAGVLIAAFLDCNGLFETCMPIYAYIFII